VKTERARGHGSDPKSTRPIIKRATQHGGEVRLIGGQWKRTRLAVPDRPGLRPTPDRVRETLFNWLGQDLSGWRVLDAFAGTGALGLEAASRGAAQVLLIERDDAAVAALQSVLQRLGNPAAVEVLRTEALMWMGRQATAGFELVFLDPPFDSTLLAPAVAAAQQLLVPGGFLFVESAMALETVPSGLLPYRSLRAGAVFAQLWQRQT